MKSQGAIATPIDPLLALRPMKRTPVTTVMRGQDHVAANSRRILARADSWGATTDILWKGALTPGCFPVVAVQAESGNIVGAAVNGSCTFYARSGADDTQTFNVSLPLGVTGTETGVAWAGSSGPWEAYILPDSLQDTTELARWSQHITCEISVTSATNVHDLIVYELPYAVAFADTDDASRWTSHIITLGNLDQTTPNLAFPVEALDASSDPRGGSVHMLDVAAAQARRLGPALLNWRGSYSATGTMLCAHEDSISEYDSDNEGFSVASGGYARRWRDNSNHVLDDRVAVIPVRLWASATVDGAGGVTRVQTAAESWVEVTHTTSGWASAFGWLEVGISADDFKVAQIFARNDGSSYVLRAVCLEYADDVEAASD